MATSTDLLSSCRANTSISKATRHPRVDITSNISRAADCRCTNDGLQRQPGALVAWAKSQCPFPCTRRIPARTPCHWAGAKAEPMGSQHHHSIVGACLETCLSGSCPASASCGTGHKNVCCPSSTCNNCANNAEVQNRTGMVALKKCGASSSQQYSPA